jgi:hypothetical protein
MERERWVGGCDGSIMIILWSIVIIIWLGVSVVVLFTFFGGVDFKRSKKE